jgi:hypothetical protein
MLTIHKQIPKVKYQFIVASVIAVTFIAALASISVTTHAQTIAFGILGTFFIGYVKG